MFQADQIISTCEQASAEHHDQPGSLTCQGGRSFENPPNFATPRSWAVGKNVVVVQAFRFVAGRVVASAMAFAAVTVRTPQAPRRVLS